MKDLYYMLRYCLWYGHLYDPGVETSDGTNIVTCAMCGHQKEYI